MIFIYAAIILIYGLGILMAGIVLHLTTTKRTLGDFVIGWTVILFLVLAMTIDWAELGIFVR